MAFLNEIGLKHLRDLIFEKFGEKYSKPADGIPASDLDTTVQTSLTKANTAIQSLNGYATETFVENKVADLVNSAPETLDTLGELAEAFENNQEVVEALDGAISNKVDKEEGKGLSSNDFTTAEKEKLAGLNNITVDPTLDSESTNPVENKAIYSGIYDPKYSIRLKDSYGDIFQLKIENDTLTSTKQFKSVSYTGPQKTTYNQYDLFDFTGCSVTGTFNHGDPIDITDEFYMTMTLGNTSTRLYEGTMLVTPGSYTCYMFQYISPYRQSPKYAFTVAAVPTLFNSYFSYSSEDWTTTIQDSSFNASLLDLNKNYKMIFDVGENITSYPATVSYYTQEDGYDENYYEFYCSGVYYPPYDITFDATIFYYESSNTVEMQIWYEDGGIGIDGSVRLVEDMQGEE